MIKFVLAAFAVAALLLTGCKYSEQHQDHSSTKPAQKATGPESGSTPINKACPFSGNAVNPEATSTYNEVTVGFCCGNCKGKFDKMSDDAKADVIGKVAK